MALMSGGALTVALGLFERFSGKNVPLWVYACVIASFVLMGCYLAWKEEREERNHSESRLTAQTNVSAAIPTLEVQIKEAIIQTIGPKTAKCFLYLTLRNLTEDAPCMIERCVLGLKIDGEWVRGGMPLDAGAFQLGNYIQLVNRSEVPLNQPYYYEDGLPIIEVSKEDITDIRSIVNEGSPLKRGFPKSGWIGFILGSLPAWPTTTESYPEEEGTTVVYKTDGVQEVEIELIDGHGAHHIGTKKRPLGEWGHQITARESSPSLGLFDS